MTSTRLPQEVTGSKADGALEVHQTTLDLADTVNGGVGRANVCVGELWVAVGAAGELPIVVTHVESDAVRFQACHRVLEAATDFDLIVEADPESGVPYSFVVSGELYGQVLVEQLTKLYGRIDVGRIAAAAGALRSDGRSLMGYRTGLALGEWTDWRRQFYTGELFDRFNAVCQPARQQYASTWDESACC